MLRYTVRPVPSCSGLPWGVWDSKRHRYTLSFLFRDDAYAHARKLNSGEG